MTTLGRLCTFINGGTPSKSEARYFDGEIPWITSADIVGPVVDSARSFITEEAIRASATNRVPAGTTLLVTRTGVGKVATAGLDLCFSQDITAVIPASARLDSAYLVHFLKTKQSYLLAEARGATIKGVTRDVVAGLEIPLPPLPEQRRIAAILDQADALRVKRREALTQLDRLTQAIFVEMFGDPVTNDRNWPSGQVSDFVAGFESGKSLVADDDEDVAAKFRVLKISAITSLEYRPEQSKAVPTDYLPPASHFVRTGDLLFSRANTTELIGATALVRDTPENLLLPDKLWRFVWFDEPRASILYVRQLFQQPKFRAEIGKRASGSSGSMQNISQPKVLSIPVGLPPLGLQTDFAKLVEEIDALKRHHLQALIALDALFTSLQHRAFAGEL